MIKKKLGVNWGSAPEDLNKALELYAHQLKATGIRESTSDSYIDRVGRYLRYFNTSRPSASDFNTFRDHLIRSGLSRSTINNYCFAIVRYHKMLGEELSFQFLKPDNLIPDFFTEDDIKRIFDAAKCNLKHYTMLNALFYGCLRASELCAIDLRDVDLENLFIRIKGKGGQDALCYISKECANILEQYLAVRPQFEIDGRQPLFFSDFGKRWCRRDLYRMFMYYKRKAGIRKRGALHVFARHSTCSLMISRGCDAFSAQQILRHKSIITTLRYVHLCDAVKREKYSQYLTL
jgi:integrase/recombinase XerD